MALIKCKECNNEVSNKAESCPNCGVKIKKKGNGCLMLILLIFIIVIVIPAITASLDQSTQKPPDSTATKAQTSTNKPASNAVIKTNKHESQAQPDQTPKNWLYHSNNDEMSSEVSKSAITLSTNTAEFAFPYHGKQHARLGIRNHPRHGKDIIFAIEKGQILCRSYKDCDVLVRFDDSPARTMKAIGSSDNSSETIFIHNFDVFFNEMKKSKKVRISTEIYKEGSPVFEFDVSNFDETKVQ